MYVKRKFFVFDFLRFYFPRKQRRRDHKVSLQSIFLSEKSKNFPSLNAFCQNYLFQKDDRIFSFDRNLYLFIYLLLILLLFILFYLFIILSKNVWFLWNLY